MTNTTFTNKPTEHVKVKFSPVGPGYITDQNERGFFRVNHVAVGWLITEQNQVIDNTGYFSIGNWKLFIDDERDPVEKHWIVARSSKEAIDYIKLVGTFPKEIAFDHDLGEDDTSIKFISWMTEMLIENSYKFPHNFKYSVHSQNPVGKMNIEGLMKNLIKHFKTT